MAKKNTDLKLNQIKKKAKEVHTKEKYPLDDGSTITFYPIFPDLMIEEMLEELQTHMKVLNEKEIKLSEKMNLYLINIMMIKYFTHFKADMPDTILGEDKESGLLDWLNHFADTGLMKIIIEEVFLKDQVTKVFDKLTEFIGSTMFLEELGKKTQEHVQKLKLQNAEVFSKLNNVDNVKADV
jgi:hypothetical protein